MLPPAATSTPIPQSGEEGILSLERRSVQPFRTQDEYLYAMREDLAEWFNTLYGTAITAETFFTELETGVLLCQHANAVQSFIADSPVNDPSSPRPTSKAISYKSNVRSGEFFVKEI